MSFSVNVKKELSERHSKDKHCNIAELAALINLCGVLHQSKKTLKIQTENISVAKKCFTLIKKAFNIKVEILIRKNKLLNKNSIYTIFIKGSDSVNNILSATGHKNTQDFSNRHISPLIVEEFCCKRAYIRGAFLGAGSIADPNKNYHLEFVNGREEHAHQLIELINSFSLPLPLAAKLALRKDYFIVYLKDSEQIAHLLNIIEAHVSLMELENVRIMKDMRNSVNRIVNCETANLKKTVGAALRQLDDIVFIKDKKGLSFLPSQLEEIARVRLQHPDVSLKEIGQMLSPSVSKSGVNYRLRKIRDIAELLRSDI